MLFLGFLAHLEHLEPTTATHWTHHCHQPLMYGPLKWILKACFFVFLWILSTSWPTHPPKYGWIPICFNPSLTGANRHRKHKNELIYNTALFSGDESTLIFILTITMCNMIDFVNKKWTSNYLTSLMSIFCPFFAGCYFF